MMAVYNVNGRELSLENIREIVERQKMSFGTFIESCVACVYEGCVSGGDVVVDGGAARGWHTFTLAKIVSPNGLVHAVEALPEDCEFLRNRAKQWRYQDQVVVHEVALGGERGTTEFYRVLNNTGLSGIKRAWVPAGATVEEIEVRMQKLEEIVAIADWQRLSFIKLDLEGGEFTALKYGAGNMLKAARPVIAFESGRWAAAGLYNYTEDEFFQFFDDLEYDLLDIFGEPLTREVFRSRAANAPSEFVAIPVEKRTLGLKERLRKFLEERVQ